MSNLEILPFANPAELAETAALWWLAERISRPVYHRPYCLALAGGRVMKAFSSKVTEFSHPWWHDDVHFFWGDERCVPPEHPESNFAAANEFLLQPLGIAANQIHRIRGEQSPELAAQETEAELRRFAPLNSSGQPVLDLVLLGMGEDGHVASLFPGESEELMAAPAVYRAVTATKPPPQRITLGYATIAAARQVWVLASGAGKERALAESLQPEGATPLARVLRMREKTVVFTDIKMEAMKGTQAA